MIYDTLFAMNDKFEITPQMVERYQISADHRTYDFTPRDRLLSQKNFSSDDVIASLKSDGEAVVYLGRRMLAATHEMVKIDDRQVSADPRAALRPGARTLPRQTENPAGSSCRLVISREHGPPADLGRKQGSGPFIFKKDKSKVRRKGGPHCATSPYKPRAEPSYWAAGGKVVKVDRLEWLAIPDPLAAVHALQVGEIDLSTGAAPRSHSPPLFSLDNDPLGNPFVLPELNRQQPPFNNQKLRQAVVAAMNQQEIVEATVVRTQPTTSPAPLC